MKSAVSNGSGERCLTLKIFVVFNPALLVESVPGILQYLTLLKTELRISDFQHFHWLAGHKLSVLSIT